jgi:hypothetical protein
MSAPLSAQTAVEYRQYRDETGALEALRAALLPCYQELRVACAPKLLRAELRRRWPCGRAAQTWRS